MKSTLLRSTICVLSECLLPHGCVLCGIVLDRGYFCGNCRPELPWTDAVCARCGLPLAKGPAVGAHCSKCQLHPPPFEKAFAPLLYTYPIDGALKALKFKRQLYYAPAFGELLLRPFEARFPDVDALLPVPLHRRRHALRGFNQAAELCRPLCRKRKLPMVDNVHRVKFTKPQTGLNAAERRRNLKAAFVVRGTLRCGHPLVVDDVITTTETCRQLAATLLRAGAKKVSVLAVARASAA